MRPRRRRIASLVAAAAAILAVAGGVVLQPWQDDPDINQMSPADQVLAAEDVKHVSIDFDDGSKATVFHSPQQGRAVLVTDDMAAPPRGKTFELWLQDDSGAMVPAGLMKKPGDNKVAAQGRCRQGDRGGDHRRARGRVGGAHDRADRALRARRGQA